MKPSELKQLCQMFGKTLDKKNKDEWYDTDKGIWDQLSKNFIQWYNNYGKKELKKNANGA